MSRAAGYTCFTLPANENKIFAAYSYVHACVSVRVYVCMGTRVRVPSEARGAESPEFRGCELPGC